MGKSEVEVEDITVRFDLVDLTERLRIQGRGSQVSRWLEDRRWRVAVEL
jgi:hypothetical protein